MKKKTIEDLLIFAKISSETIAMLEFLKKSARTFYCISFLILYSLKCFPLYPPIVSVNRILILQKIFCHIQLFKFLPHSTILFLHLYNAIMIIILAFLIYDLLQS